MDNLWITTGLYGENTHFIHHNPGKTYGYPGVQSYPQKRELSTQPFPISCDFKSYAQIYPLIHISTLINILSAAPAIVRQFPRFWFKLCFFFLSRPEKNLDSWMDSY